MRSIVRARRKVSRIACGRSAAALALALGFAACGGDRRSEAAAGDTAAAATAGDTAAASPVPDTVTAVRPDTSADLAAREAPTTTVPEPGSAVARRSTDTAGAAPAKPTPQPPEPAPKPAPKPAPTAARETAATRDTGAPPPQSAQAQPKPPAAQQDAPLRDAYHQPPRDTVSQEVYDGWKQYNLNCARCHGEDVLGTTIAPHLIVSLKPDGPINTKEQFVQVTCAGRPDKGMPAWCALGLEMEKINQIYSYVKGRSAGEIAPGRPAVQPGG